MRDTSSVDELRRRRMNVLDEVLSYLREERDTLNGRIRALQEERDMHQRVMERIKERTP